MTGAALTDALIIGLGAALGSGLMIVIGIGLATAVVPMEVRYLLRRLGSGNRRR